MKSLFVISVLLLVICHVCESRLIKKGQDLERRYRNQRPVVWCGDVPFCRNSLKFEGGQRTLSMDIRFIVRVMGSKCVYVQLTEERYRPKKIG